MTSSLGILLVVMVTAAANGFWFGKNRQKVDCQVTLWSKWTTSSAWEAESKIRTRHILRHPMNGGEECPQLQEEEVINKTERIELTATKMVSSFLSSRRTGYSRVARSTGYRRDLTLIVDSSGSISESDFTAAKDELARLLGNICPVGNPFFRDIHKAALVRYSTTVTEIFDFNTYPDTTSIQTAIRNMEYIGESTCTGDAFEYARNVIFTATKGMRNQSDVRHEVLILTDGQSNCGVDAVSAARLLKQANIDVYGLMIGSFTHEGKAELGQYVSDVGTHLFAVENFQDLTLLVDKVEKIVKETPCLGFELY